jgi:hypothetical protein
MALPVDAVVDLLLMLMELYAPHAGLPYPTVLHVLMDQLVLNVVQVII